MWFLFSSTQIQNNSVLQRLPPLLPSHLICCSVGTLTSLWLILASWVKPWSWTSSKTTPGKRWWQLPDSSLEQAPQDRLPPIWECGYRAGQGYQAVTDSFMSLASVHREKPGFPLPQPSGFSLSLRRLEDLWLIAAFLSRCQKA